MIHPDPVGVFGKSGLARIMAARLQSSSEPTVQDFADFCTRTLRLKLIEERSLAWQQSWIMIQDPSTEEEQQTWGERAPDCLPVLRSEFNGRLWEWLFKESLPRFEFDFESDQYREQDWFSMDAPTRLLAELEILAKIIHKPAEWQFDNNLDEVCVRETATAYGPGFATLHVLGLDAPGHHLIGDHSKVLSSLQREDLGAVDFGPLQEAVVMDIHLVEEMLVEKEYRYADQLDMISESEIEYEFQLKRQEGKRALQALLNKLRFERLSGTELESGLHYTFTKSNGEEMGESLELLTEEAIIAIDSNRSTFSRDCDNSRQRIEVNRLSNNESMYIDLWAPF